MGEGKHGGHVNMSGFHFKVQKFYQGKLRCESFHHSSAFLR